MENLMNKLIEWGAQTGIKIVIALIILMITFRIITVLGRRIEKRAETNPKMDKTLTKTLVYMGKIALKIIVVITLVGFLGIDTSGLTALVASLGVCAGLAVNGALSNFAGGVLILITRPFKVDDYISVAGYEGTVKDIFIINTKILTLDNKVVYLPNGTVSSSPIVNYTAQGIRRVDLEMSIAYGNDFKKAEEILMNVLTQHEKVLQDPAPTVRMVEHGESGIKLCCRPWVDVADYWDVYFDVLEQTKEAFDEQGITIPYNQLDVHVHNKSLLDRIVK